MRAQPQGKFNVYDSFVSKLFSPMTLRGLTLREPDRRLADVPVLVDRRQRKRLARGQSRPLRALADQAWPSLKPRT